MVNSLRGALARNRHYVSSNISLGERWCAIGWNKIRRSDRGDANIAASDGSNGIMDKSITGGFSAAALPTPRLREDIIQVIISSSWS